MHLRVNNSVTIIMQASQEEFDALRDLLSYRPPFNPFYNNPELKHLVTKRGEFSTGLLDRALEKFPNTTLKDLRIRPPRMPGIHGEWLPGPTPYTAQQNAVAACLRSFRGVVEMPTGTGKSLTMALLIQALQVKTLIIVPTLELKKQLKATLANHFTYLDNITVENIDSPALLKLTKFDCLILDEAHRAAATTYRKLNKKQWVGIYYRYFFTATAFRSKEEEDILLESIIGDRLYSLPYQQAVNDAIIVPMEAYYVKVPKTVPDGYPLNWKAIYTQLVINNNVRNALIRQLIERFQGVNISTLCLVKEIEHGNNLMAICSGKTYFVNGSGDSLQNETLIPDFNTGKIKSLIGTEGILGEGVDTKPCEVVIIAGLGKSKPRFMQACGRAFRNYPGKDRCTIIIFRDDSHKWTINHFKAQCKILKEAYGVIPKELTLD